MKEKEARKVFEELKGTIAKQKDAPKWFYSKGYLEGLEDGRKEEREKAKPLVEALENIFDFLDDHVFYGNHIEKQMDEIEKALAKYQEKK